MLVGSFTLLPGVFILPRIFKVEIRTVVSGSMEPAIERGSIVVAKPVSPEDLFAGDVILFHQPEDPTRIVTHRIVEIDEGPPRTIYTRGDANNNRDHWRLNGGEVVGKAIFNIPKIGYLAEIVRSPLGFVTFLLLPGLMLLVSEIPIWYRFIMYGDEAMEFEEASDEMPSSFGLINARAIRIPYRKR